MERKAPLPPISRNKNAPKAPESGTPRVGNQLVRMRSPVQIWIAAPPKPQNRNGSGVFNYPALPSWPGFGATLVPASTTRSANRSETAAAFAAASEMT